MKPAKAPASETDAQRMKDPMKPMSEEKCDCTAAPKAPCCDGPPLEMLPIHSEPAEKDEPCCGPPAGPSSSANERPGYVLCRYVEGFLQTPAATVPRISARLDRHDKLGALKVRLGVGRNDYKVAPGLYAVGRPDGAAPVLVSANYKLSFDHLRCTLQGLDAWILVLDTRGINVWCAAGKGTFGTAELVWRVQAAGLAQMLDHRKLIVPQLGATGVSAHQVKKACGFEVVWGPILAEDIRAFIAAGLKAEERMRRVTFDFKQRLVLVPVEISLLGKALLWILAGLFVVSGIGRHVFSFAVAWQRGLAAALFCVLGIVAGCVLVPALLPWLPGRAFSLKGAVAGVAIGVAGVAAMATRPVISLASGAALILLATAISSYLAMNFTGSTPFTSPTGVEKEMRRAIPLQLLACLLAAGLWIAAGFAG
jgi:hypothetical protein